MQFFAAIIFFCTHGNLLNFLLLIIIRNLIYNNICLLLEPISIVRPIVGGAGIAGLATANSLARPSGPTGHWLTGDAGILELATANSFARSSGHDGGTGISLP